MATDNFLAYPIDQVVAAMQQFWPSTKINHRSVVNRYYDLVKSAVVRGRHMADPEAVKFDLIPVSFKQIRDQLGRYGARDQQKYWFDWFQTNYPLMEPVVKGSNLGRNRRGSLTMIKFTKEIERMLACASIDEIWHSYYPDLESNPERFDLVTVDLDSLDAYIRHNKDTQQYQVNRASHKTQLEHNLKTAELIYRLADRNQGVLPQRISISSFGRRYYSGPNLQTASRIVRHAALGSCYQYDIEASVFTWKFDLAKQIDPGIRLPATLDYLDFKQRHRQRLAQLMFENSTTYFVDLIKQVITAVGFGARTTNIYGWYDQGKWRQSSIQQIIRSTEKIRILFADSWFKEFVCEQDQMNALIFATYRSQLAEVESVKTLNGQISRNRSISYLYQHTEARIIESLQRRLNHWDQDILLLCHDGFYTRLPADIVDLRYELQQFLPHGRLDQERHQAFRYNPDAVLELEQHRRRIRDEEQQVANLFNRPLHQPRPLSKFVGIKNDDYDSGYDDGTLAYTEPISDYWPSEHLEDLS